MKGINMFKVRLMSIVAVLAVLGIVSLDNAWAQAKGEGKEIPKERQEKLLAAFGDEGIDADGDGVLTRAEVRQFFGDQRGDKMGRRGGKHGDTGKGRHGRGDQQGRFGDKGRQIIGMIERLENLDPAKVPAEFDAEKHSRIDSDGNGQLSSEEWSAFVAKVRPRLVERLIKEAPGIDADKDGDISTVELSTYKTECQKKQRARLLEKHPEADTDGNGVLSEEEAEAFHKTIMEKRNAMFLKKNPAADTDGDGKLSKEEMEACQKTQMRQRAAKLLEKHPEADLDGDGELSREEFRKFRGNQRGPGEGKGRPHHRGGGPRGPELE